MDAKKKWRDNNQKYIKEYLAKYRLENKEKILKQAREYNHSIYKPHPRSKKPEIIKIDHKLKCIRVDHELISVRF